MPRASETVTIARPAAEVFAFIADGANNPKWRSDRLQVKQITPGPIGVGTVFEQKQDGPMGRRIAADYEITEYEPSARLSFRVAAGPARPEGHYTFESVGGSTRVQFELSWAPAGFARLLAPMVARQMPIEVARLRNVKRVLETANG
jgi:uncharacterized protein YndB with AHSA1/START domain